MHYRLPGHVTDVHVAGWTIVQVAGDLDAAAVAELAAHVAPSLTDGTRVALDLRGILLDPDTGAEAIRSLAATAKRAGAEMVTIEREERTRELLRSAGVPEVYESLDTALHVSTPLLRTAGVPQPEPPLIPAAGDALLVATEDLVGGGEAG